MLEKSVTHKFNSIYSCLLSAHTVLCKLTVDVISVQYLLITYRESPILLRLFK